ncbi:hypothetical protein ACVILH_005527 [Bradyrhizobium sp. USDA 4353]
MNKGSAIPRLFDRASAGPTKEVVVPGKPHAHSAWGADPGPITTGRGMGHAGTTSLPTYCRRWLWVLAFVGTTSRVLISSEC